MEYRQLGNTGKKVSAIGLGLEYVDFKPYEQVKETIDAALHAGVNIMDVFMPGLEVRENIAKALGKNRDKVMIQGHIGSTNINQQYDISRDMPIVKEYFETLLRLFGGYIDIGMLFFIDSEDDYKNVFETEFIEYAVHLKKQGDIGHIGFSSHSPERAIKAINTGIPEMMMFSVNPAFDMLPASEYVFDHSEKGFGVDLFNGLDPKRAELYALCEQKGIGITAMKPFGSGKLISAEHTPFAKPMSVLQCVHYALSRPAVASVLPGCKTANEMQDVLRYYDVSKDELDYSEIITTMQKDFRGSCVYCSHCQPCPVEIDIATVIKYLDIAKLDVGNIPPSIKSHYNGLNNKGSDCIECGNCETRCPFSVPIISNMKNAAELFEKN